MSQFFIGGRGSDFKPKCPIFYVPKCLGCQGRMGQCPLFLFFFYFEGIPNQQLLLPEFHSIHTLYILYFFPCFVLKTEFPTDKMLYVLYCTLYLQNNLTSLAIEIGYASQLAYIHLMQKV